mmetsp:Transcript_33514/g.53972  ORF Transcript_33514/g.53972 Transcript_33514/m.53972 type:complete len:90 (+) Transcript_33514:309-578(+)
MPNHECHVQRSDCAVVLTMTLVSKYPWKTVWPLWKRAYTGILEHIPEETAGEIFAQTCSEDNAALFGTPRQEQREYFATIPLQPYLSHA